MTKRATIFSKFLAYTLLEIIIVVVIIGLLAVIASVSYRLYIIRSRTSEAVLVLSEYQASAMQLYSRYGTIDPYYVLFKDQQLTGFVSGAPAGTSAEKQVTYKFIDSVSAFSGTSGSNTYILIGVGFIHNSSITAGADHMYIAGTQTPDGVISWQCGKSASQANNIGDDYLPKNCLNSLP